MFVSWYQPQSYRWYESPTQLNSFQFPQHEVVFGVFIINHLNPPNKGFQEYFKYSLAVKELLKLDVN